MYRTFKRSCRNWREFARTRKITVDRGLTYAEAVARCKEFNDRRTPRQIRAGTLMEFDKE